MNNTLHEHLQIAHDYWKKLLISTDNVIDATCGNGKDSLFLANLVKKGRLFCYDIQKESIDKTTSFLKENSINLEKVTFFNDSHETFSKIPHLSKIKLIIYNLGYLPGGDKTITTKKKSTLSSIKEALELIIPLGAISISIYSGHKEGAVEKTAIFKLLEALDKKKFIIATHQWETKNNAPCLVWITKIK